LDQLVGVAPTPSVVEEQTRGAPADLLDIDVRVSREDIRELPAVLDHQARTTPPSAN
jgi:hypothetical protein